VRVSEIEIEDGGAGRRNRLGYDGTESGEGGRATRRRANNPLVLENDYHRLTVDPQHGCITSWYDRSLDRELIDQHAPWGLGQFLYAEGGEGTRLTSNRADLPEGNPRILTDFRPSEIRQETDRLAHRLHMRASIPVGVLDMAIILWYTGTHIELQYTLHKEDRLAKEAAYIAFPLELPDAEVLSDSQLGWVNWRRDRLPGACVEWLPLQTGILARGQGADVLICSPDVPLFCIGDIVRGHWPRDADLTGGRIFSYVLNNYWHTNYKASQGGPISFRYRLFSGRAIGPSAAHRHGWELRRPLYAHRISFQDFRHERLPYSDPTGGTLARLDAQSTVISTIKGARWADGFIVRLQETAGANDTPVLSFPNRRVLRAWRCDLHERETEEIMPGDDGTLSTTVPAWGMTTLRILVVGKEAA
jgi:hypothetical protein